MSPRGSCRKRSEQGFTLIELAVVLAVLGVVAVAATSMKSGARVVASIKSEQEARLLSQAFRTARITAIATSQPVRLRVIRDQREFIGFQTLSDVGRQDPLQPDHFFAGSLSVRWSESDVVFYSTGMTDRSATVSIQGEDSSWRVDLVQASGQAIVTKLP